VGICEPLGRLLVLAHRLQLGLRLSVTVAAAQPFAPRVSAGVKPVTLPYNALNEYLTLELLNLLHRRLRVSLLQQHIMLAASDLHLFLTTATCGLPPALGPLPTVALSDSCHIGYGALRELL
jgi:hypothetical protein